jgi:Fe(3+) dicitrate transport protein
MTVSSRAYLATRIRQCLSQPGLSSRAAVVGTALAASASALAQTPNLNLPSIEVVGQQEGAIARQPGAVSMVSAESLALQQPDSTEEALRNVPGVVIKPEEESAIVANIGVRGLSAADYKTLILEDGVPVAPGLFVGNARYYNPRIQRMDSIELLKGAASLRYGPSTIGGVINYITKQPDDGVALSLRGGSFGSTEALLEIGGSSASREALFGAVITHAESDGFMDKGYEMTDVMIKTGLAIHPDQWLSLKYTQYDNEANISYRGIFLNDFRIGRTYNPAPDDWFLTDRRSLDLNHAWELADDVRLNTLVYWSEVTRDYWRFAVDNDASVAAGRWVFTDSLNGNNRSFDRYGVELRLQAGHASFGIDNEAEIGVRYMTEEMRDQTIAASRETPRSGTINRDRLDAADSVALYVQNRFILSDALAVTPGVRVEWYEQRRRDLRRPAGDNLADTSNTEVMPGVGVTYQLSAESQLFGGVYKAFSPALNGDALDGLQDQELEAERSVNIELGLRGQKDRFNYELAVFRMDFSNQIIPANSNSEFQNTNGGKTLHQGLEAALGVELGGGLRLDSNLTYVPDAEFVGDRRDAEGNVTTPDGNRVTYTPELVANFSVEYAVGKLRSALTANHVGQHFTDTANTRSITENTSGFFTGEVEAYTIYNAKMLYTVSPNLELSASIKNLTDERYIASLRQGIYVGPARAAEAGVRYRF